MAHLGGVSSHSQGVFHWIKLSRAEVLDLNLDLFPVNCDNRGEPKAGFALGRDLFQGMGVFVA